jgi:peptide/nickel transport system permease protein
LGVAIVIWRRILAIIPIVLIASFGVFVLEGFLPGDAAVTLAGPNASVEQIGQVRDHLNLDEPLPVRYARWVGNAVHGNFGDSLYTHASVLSEITSRSLVTLSLVIGATAVALLIGLPLGILAGTRRGGILDRFAALGSTLGIAVPSFVVAILLIVVFSIKVKLLPTAGYVNLSEGWWVWASHLILPVLALSCVPIAELTRQIRSSLAEVLDADYIRTLRGAGLAERVVVLNYALRIAISPAISVLSVQVARMIGGAVVVESVFNLPGLGNLTKEAILTRDLPVLQGVVPLAALVAVLFTLLADLIHHVLDPRVRMARAGA